MEMIECACGCGLMRRRYDAKGRERYYLRGHQNRAVTDAQRAASRRTLARIRPSVPWNKGRSYTIAKRAEYANKGAWAKAMFRMFGNRCMRCGWAEAPCDIHHITPKSEGGRFTIENGVVICPNCHRLIHAGKITAADLATIRGAAAPINPRV